MTDQEKALLEKIEKVTEKLYEKQESFSNRVWDVALKAAGLTVPLVIGWLWQHEKNISRNDTRLQLIEDSRFTQEQARNMEDRLKDAVFDVRAEQVSQNVLLQELMRRQDREEEEDK